MKRLGGWRILIGAAVSTAVVILGIWLAVNGFRQVMGVQDYGLDVGCSADLLLVEAETVAEAVVMHPARRAVIKAGRVVARDGKLV